MRDIFSSSSFSSAFLAKNEVVKMFTESAPEFCDWLDEIVEEGFAFMNFPRKMNPTVNMVERLNKELRRRTKVARLFPNTESCLRLVTAVLQERHEDWKSGRAYVNSID